MTDCIFCKISQGQIPAKVILETNTVIGFSDIAPQAPVHYLVSPKAHIRNMVELANHDSDLMASLIHAISSIATQTGISETGFRVVANTGDDGGQTVDHLHFHVLGGRSLTWPPG